MNSDVSSHPWRPRLPGVLLVLCLALLLTTGCSPSSPPEAPRCPTPGLQRFFKSAAGHHPRLRGGCDATFHHADGVFLLFNNRSDPREDTHLHIAERIDDLTFHYLGELAGINSAGLDAAASVDNTNTLYFVSARNFGKTDETIYQSHFDAGVVSRIEPVSGISSTFRDA